MNDTVHGHMVQDLLRHRFGSHDNLICKYSSKYPVQAEREFQRLTNAYIRILNELLKEYLPEIRERPAQSVKLVSAMMTLQT